MEDLYHDAFQAYLDACRSGRFDEEKGNGRQYIFSAGKNIYFKQYERKSRLCYVDDEALTILARFEEKDEYSNEELGKIVREKIIPRLSKTDKEILWNSIVNHWTLAEIAEHLNMSLAAVKMRKLRTLEKLRQLFQR